MERFDDQSSFKVELPRAAIRGTWLDPRRWPAYHDKSEIFWPRPSLHMAPSPQAAVRLAEIVAFYEPALTDPVIFAKKLGIKVRYRKIPSSRLGIEAWLTPRENGFDVIVDSNLEVPEAKLRIAHEIAHTVFYDWRYSPPERTSRGGPDEERFCDAFALALSEINSSQGVM